MRIAAAVAVMFFTTAQADELPQQLYAALGDGNGNQTGVLILTVEPCNLNYTGFEYAAYATIFLEKDDKVGCWHKETNLVQMKFQDQPGIHSWRDILFSPIVPDGSIAKSE